MELGIFITQRCNAQCTHCTTDSGPYKTESLALAKIKTLMDEAADLSPPGEPLGFSLTGGEAFLDLALLIEIVRYGAGLGATISCVTNGFWASSEEKAKTTIGSVREAGLSRLAMSTSRYHQQFVRIERVRSAVSAARAAGINTLLKIAYSVQDEKEEMIQRWSDFVGADAVQTFPVVPYLRQGATLAEEDYVRLPGLPTGLCPSPSLTIRENGAAYTCCAPGAFEPLLQVGNVFDGSLEDILANYHFDPVLQVLRERGPIYFAQYAISQGKGGALRDSYGDECDLCAHIVSDPTLKTCVRESARAFRKQWAKEVSTAMRMNAAAGDT